MGATAIARRVGMLIVLTGLLAVVAMASHLPLSGHAAGNDSTRDLGSVIWALVAVVVVAAIALPAAIVSLFRGALRRRTPDAELVPRTPPIPAWKALPMLALLVALAVAVVVLVFGGLGGSKVQPPSILRPGPVKDAAAPVSPRGAAGGSGFGLSAGVVIVGAGLLVLLLATAVVVALRSRKARREAAGTRDQVLEAEIKEAIADVISGSSVRLAVIGAYVQMERALAARALARRISEAPREYLARARATFGGAGESVDRLTELFEEAKFSPHEIGEPMRQDALDALDRIRAELGGER